MILSDGDIRRRHEAFPLISPFVADNVQPASVDLTLDKVFLVPDCPHPLTTIWDDGIDLNDIPGTASERYTKTTQDAYALAPHTFVLGSTAEWVDIPSDLVASVEGKSSLARLGLFVHVTAGFIDPGFRGKITLELANFNERVIILRSGLRICQIAFSLLLNSAERPYGD